jgi:type VI secretion system protein ImpA
MPTPPVLEIEPLLAEIPGDNPAGGRTPLPMRQKMEQARKEFEPNPEDPSQPPIPKKPDWPGIIRMSKDILTNQSKDLEVALRLLEALTRLHGIPGFRDGLRLLHEMTERCWDRMHPIPDPEDGEGMEVRAERFNWIGDNDTGARFPNTLRDIPVVRVEGQPASLKDRQAAAEGRGELSSSAFETATPLSDTLVEDLRESIEEFQRLDNALSEKLGNHSPGFVGLREALDQLQDYVLRLADRQTETDSQSEGPNKGSSNEDGGQSAGGGMRISTGSIHNREDAFRMIAQIADNLERLEPHSPMPALLRKALTLGRMSFRDLLAHLIRDEGALFEIKREFGLSDDAGSVSGYSDESPPE